MILTNKMRCMEVRRTTITIIEDPSCQLLTCYSLVGWKEGWLKFEGDIREPWTLYYAVLKTYSFAWYRNEVGDLAALSTFSGSEAWDNSL